MTLLNGTISTTHPRTHDDINEQLRPALTRLCNKKLAHDVENSKKELQRVVAELSPSFGSMPTDLRRQKKSLLEGLLMTYGRSTCCQSETARSAIQTLIKATRL